MTLRDGMVKEVGGGFRMWDTVNPWLIHDKTTTVL